MFILGQWGNSAVWLKCAFCFNLQQLPGGSCIFNPLQQEQQLSQFSPQQQSQQPTTCSPQQQGEQVCANSPHSGVRG